MAIRVKHSAHGDFHGTTWTILSILLMVKSTDIGAYFGGRVFGRHKLILWLSPGKTWEGLLCGLLTAGLVGMACAPWINHVTWKKGFAFGVVIGGIGQLGDLLESLMKRDAGGQRLRQSRPRFRRSPGHHRQPAPRRTVCVSAVQSLLTNDALLPNRSPDTFVHAIESIRTKGELTTMPGPKRLPRPRPSQGNQTRRQHRLPAWRDELRAAP